MELNATGPDVKELIHKTLLNNTDDNLGQAVCVCVCVCVCVWAMLHGPSILTPIGQIQQPIQHPPYLLSLNL